MKVSRQELFERASIPRAYFALTIPSVLGKIVTLFYNMADTWFIAAMDNASMVAGVALCGPIFMLMIAAGDIFGLGGTSVISRLFGKGDTEQAGKISAFCHYGAFATGLVMAVLLLLFQDPILTLLGADDSTRPYAAQYYRVIALCAPIIITPIVPLNLLRSEGMSRASMFGSAMGSVVNVILDPVFIFVLDLGAAGAAIATVLGNAASILLYMAVIKRKAQFLTVSPRMVTWKRDMALPVLAIGIPASVNNVMNSVGTAVCNNFLLLYGSDKIAAMGIASKISMIAVMMVIGFTFSAGPLVGYTYGKGDGPKLRRILRFFYTFQIGLSASAAAVLSILAPWLVGSFMDDPAILNAGTAILRWQLAGMPFMAIVMVSTCILQATGKSRGALTLSLCRQGVVYMAVIFLANRLLGYAGVISAQFAADILSAAIAITLIIRYFKEKRGSERPS